MSVTPDSFVPGLIAESYQGGRTGILVLKHGAISKMIHFNAGEIVYATSNQEADQLGELLIKWERITRADWQRVTEKLYQHELKLAEALQRECQLELSELTELIAQQIQQIITDTFIWTQFESKFIDCELPGYEIDLSKDKSLPATLQLLLNGIRALDNILFIKNLIGDLHLPLRLIDDQMRVYQLFSFEPSEAFLLSCLEQRPQSTNDLLKLGSIPEPVVLKTICALRLTGMLLPAETPSARAALEEPAAEISAGGERSAEKETPPSEPHSLPVSLPDMPALDTRTAMEFCYQVEAKVHSINAGASIYQILESHSHADEAALQQAYQRLMIHYHPLRQQQLNEFNLDLSNDLEYISAALNQAYQVLCDPGKNYQYESEMSKLYKRATPTTSAGAPPETATATREPAPQQTTQQDLMEFCYQIESKQNELKNGATCYQLLELERNSKAESIEEAYHTLSQRFNYNRQQELAAYGINMTGQLTEISTALQRAYETLTNPYLKRQYDEKLLKELRRDSGQFTIPNAPPDLFTPPKAPPPPPSANTTAPTAAPKTPTFIPPPPANTTAPTTAPKVPTFIPPPPPVKNRAGADPRNDPRNTTPSIKALPLEFTRNNQPTSANPANNANPANSVNSTNSAGSGPARNAPFNSSPGTSSSGISSPGTSSAGTNSPATSSPGISSPGTRPPLASPIMASPVRQGHQNAPVARPANISNNPSQNAATNPGSGNRNVGETIPPAELPRNAPPGKKSRALTATEYYMQGIELSDQQRLEEAAEALRKAVEIAPKDPEYWGQLGRIYGKMHGSQKQAEWAYYEAMRLDPNDADYPFELGKCYQKYGLYRKAAEMYQRALQIDAHHSAAQWALNELPKPETKPKQGLLSRLGLGGNKDS